MRTLIWLHYSPWSIKARWALTHWDLEHELRSYIPMVAEPLLRLRTGKIFEKATVPVLLDGDRVLTDSFAIARYAEEQGEEQGKEGRGEVASLFPEGQEQAVARVNALSDRLCAAGRLRTTRRVMRDDAALIESVPFPRPPGSSAILLSIGRVGARFLERSYGEGEDDATCLRRMGEALEEIEEIRAGRDEILGIPSYADYAVAAALQFVEPVEGHVRLGHASRRCWYEAELAERFEGLLRFRDRIFEERPLERAEG